MAEDASVVVASEAAGDQGREEDDGQSRVTEVLEGQRTQLLQDGRRLTRLDNVLWKKGKIIIGLQLGLRERVSNSISSSGPQPFGENNGEYRAQGAGKSFQ